MDLTKLYKIALIKARDLKFDVFNCLDIMNNKEVFEKLLFCPGNGYL